MVGGQDFGVFASVGLSTTQRMVHDANMTLGVMAFPVAEFSDFVSIIWPPHAGLLSAQIDFESGEALNKVLKGTLPFMANKTASVSFDPVTLFRGQVCRTWLQRDRGGLHEQDDDDIAAQDIHDRRGWLV